MKRKKKPSNPKGSFIIHSDHSQPPPRKHKMIIMSFDPGENNFDIRIEKRVSSKGEKYCSSITTVFQERLQINYKRKKYPLVGGRYYTTSESTRSIINKMDYLSKYLHTTDSDGNIISKLDILIVERQMEINRYMMDMMHTLITYFLVKYPTSFVIEISSKLKSKNMGAPKLSRPKLKEWTADLAEDIAERRDDQVFLDFLSELIKTGMDKYDSTDNLVMIEATCIEIGYPLTPKKKRKKQI